MSEGVLLKIMLGCLAFLVVELIKRLSKGNETLAEVNKNVAVILVKLEAFETRINKLEIEIHSVRNRLHELGNHMNGGELQFVNLSEKIAELKLELHELRANMEE